MKGEEAIAMACAAFCIPTSITIVRLTEALNLPILDMPELHAIATTISIAADRPKEAKFPAISVLYRSKNHQGGEGHPAQDLADLDCSFRAVMLEQASGKKWHENQYDILYKKLSHRQFNAYT